MKAISLSILERAVRASFAADTSGYDDSWNTHPPAYGHCAVCALLVHELLGAQIWRADVPLELKTAHELDFGSHYWNEMNGAVIDLTRSQFPNGFPYVEFVNGRLGKTTRRPPEYLTENAGLMKRYALFKERVLGRIS